MPWHKQSSTCDTCKFRRKADCHSDACRTLVAVLIGANTAHPPEDGRNVASVDHHVKIASTTRQWTGGRVVGRELTAVFQQRRIDVLPQLGLFGASDAMVLGWFRIKR